jgi:hypothetical protein
MPEIDPLFLQEPDGRRSGRARAPRLRSSVPPDRSGERRNGSGSAHDEREVMDEQLAAYDQLDASAGLWCAVT